MNDTSDTAVSPQELAAMEAYLAKVKSRPRTPRIKVENDDDGPIKLSVDHPSAAVGEALLQQALGVADGDVLDGLLRQIVNAATVGEMADPGNINFWLKTVAGIKPKDHVEAMLAMQMVAVHNATMTFSRRLNHVQTLQQQDSAMNAFNKLSRTFVAQLEALKRYRTGGEQKVTVEHVTVNEGGQAIVGAVGGGRGANIKGGATS
jgi:hypothetical protein